MQNSEPDAAQSFEFNGNGDIGGLFYITDSSGGTTGTPFTLTNLTPATYTIVQTAASGWTLTDITQPYGDVPTRTATINVAADQMYTVTFTNTQDSVAPVLDHFDFDTITGTKTAGTPFDITITAKDSSGATVTSYTGTNTLTPSTGTISPTSTTAFTAGVWTGSVTLYTSGSGITIGTTGDTKTGTSNQITVNAGTGTFGNSGSSNGQSLSVEDAFTGSAFTTPSYSVTA